MHQRLFASAIVLLENLIAQFIINRRYSLCIKKRIFIQYLQLLILFSQLFSASFYLVLFKFSSGSSASHFLLAPFHQHLTWPTCPLSNTNNNKNLTSQYPLLPQPLFLKIFSLCFIHSKLYVFVQSKNVLQLLHVLLL